MCEVAEATFEMAVCEFVGQMLFRSTNLPMLTYLSLRGNSLSGSIPSTVSKLVNLQVLDLRDNELTGEFAPPSYALAASTNNVVFCCRYFASGSQYNEITDTARAFWNSCVCFLSQ